jgi:hypothetical protein
MVISETLSGINFRLKGGSFLERCLGICGYCLSWMQCVELMQTMRYIGNNSSLSLTPVVHLNLYDSSIYDITSAG